jgi:phosphate transport system permease protein
MPGLATGHRLLIRAKLIASRRMIMASGAEALPADGAKNTLSGSARSDNAFVVGSMVVAGLVIAIMIGIVFVLVTNSWLAIQEFGLRFFTTSDWNPVLGEFGALAFIYGTIVTSAIGLLLAAPIAVGSAIYLVEYAPGWFRQSVGFLTELLAAIPSIIYGLWGFFVLAPFMRDHVQPFLQTYLGPIPIIGGLFQGPMLGKDLLTAGVILAIMILPTIMAVSREIIYTVPDAQREGMIGLGATKWETIVGAVLPYARTGIIGACVLGLARALGETMAVTMVIGNSSTRITGSLFTPGYTLASAIANQFLEADTPIFQSAVVYCGVALIVITIGVSIGARILVNRTAAPSGARV